MVLTTLCILGLLNLQGKLWVKGANWDPYRNPSPLGEVDRCFIVLILLCELSWSILTPKKFVRVCELIIPEKNRWEDINIIQVYSCTYNKRNQLVHSFWRILTIKLYPKSLLVDLKHVYRTSGVVCSGNNVRLKYH